MIKDLDLLRHCNYWTYKEAILILTHEDWDSFLEYVENERAACWFIGEGGRIEQLEDPESRIFYSDDLRDFWNLINFLNREISTGEIKLYLKEGKKPSNEWKLDRQSFLDWVRKYKETIFSKRHFPHDKRDILKELLNEKEPKGFFPAPEGTDWEQVRFKITKDVQIKIKIKAKEQLFSLEKIKELFSNPEVKVLLEFISKKGKINKRQLDDRILKNNLKQYISRLRTRLKELFEIDEDPIQALGNGEYTTRFVIEHENTSPSEEESLNPEDNTPLGITPEKDPNQ